MNVRTRFVDRVAFFDLVGDLTVEANTERLHRELEELPAGAARRVVLDLSGVRALDAGGIGQLVRLYLKASSRDLRFELANLSPIQRELLGLVQLLDVLGVREAEDGPMPAERAPRPRRSVSCRWSRVAPRRTPSLLAS